VKQFLLATSLSSWDQEITFATANFWIVGLIWTKIDTKTTRHGN